MDLGLTSGPFAVLVVGLAVLLPLVFLSLWSRTPGKPVTRAVQRWALVVLAQGSAVLAVLVIINNQYGLYSSWDDLLGRPSTSGAAISAPPPTRSAQNGGAATRSPTPPQVMPWVNGAPAGFTTYRDSSTFQAKVVIPGSGGASGTVLVAVPPEYTNPANSAMRFPVVMLFPGYPGSPSTWLHAMDVVNQLASVRSQGVPPYVLVMPQISVSGAPDLECTDLPGQPQIATFLTLYVPAVIQARFRVRVDSAGWGAMGYSEGGYCAAALALRHPSTFTAGVMISGYTAPESGYFSSAQRHSGDLGRLLSTRPPAALLATASRTDPQSGTGLPGLVTSARAPTTVSVQVYDQGGHNTADFSARLPDYFRWLSKHVGGAT